MRRVPCVFSDAKSSRVSVNTAAGNASGARVAMKNELKPYQGIGNHFVGDLRLNGPSCIEKRR